jgi:hypothetical protein
MYIYHVDENGTIISVEHQPDKPAAAQPEETSDEESSLMSYYEAMARAEAAESDPGWYAEFTAPHSAGRA